MLTFRMVFDGRSRVVGITFDEIFLLTRQNVRARQLFRIEASRENALALFFLVAHPAALIQRETNDDNANDAHQDDDVLGIN